MSEAWDLQKILNLGFQLHVLRYVKVNTFIVWIWWILVTITEVVLFLPSLLTICASFDIRLWRRNKKRLSRLVIYSFWLPTCFRNLQSKLLWRPSRTKNRIGVFVFYSVKDVELEKNKKINNNMSLANSDYVRNYD